jgi:hypothetical protein
LKLTDTIYPWLLPTLRSAVRLTRFLYLITSMPAFDTLHQQLRSAWSPTDLVLSAYAWLDTVKAASKFPDTAFTSTCLEYRDSSSCGRALIRLCASTRRHLILLSPGLKGQKCIFVQRPADHQPPNFTDFCYTQTLSQTRMRMPELPPVAQ